MKKIKFLLAINFFLFFVNYHFLHADEIFTTPKNLENAVEFWKSIYSKYTTNEGLIHDEDDLGIIYEVLDLKKAYTPKLRKALIKNTKYKYEKILKSIVKKEATNLTVEESNIYSLFKKDASLKRIREAADNIRFQLGQQDRFSYGIIRSGKYIENIKAILSAYNVPTALAYLPHVESSFNLKAYSKFGAAGIWQFIRSTGRKYLTINYAIDERLDPIIATHAAARLLKHNYEELGSWPLAVMAYNHGSEGIKRAINKLNTLDVETIIFNYQGRVFKFASRNFYCEFLAAKEVAENYSKYFGELTLDTSFSFDTLILSDYININALSKFLNVSLDEIQQYNPALRPNIYSKQARLPKGYELKIKKGSYDTVLALYTNIPKTEKYSEQVRTGWYKVKRKDTLTSIAKIFNAPVSELKKLNFLRTNKIYIGQTLKIPEGTYVSVATTTRELPKIEIKKVAFVETSKPSNIAQITIESEETLGNISEWLNLTLSYLRKINKFKKGKEVKIGEKIKVDYKNITEKEFDEKRDEYHNGIEEDFRLNYKVVSTIEHKMKSNETLWYLSYKKYTIPVWLIERYNPDINLGELKKDQALTIPIVSPISSPVPEEGTETNGVNNNKVQIPKE
jgi:membrane-bound lytic murein transglycosylase D